MRWVEGAIQSSKLAGIGLPEEPAKRFNEIQLELTSLSTNFQNNTIDATNKWKKLITDKSELVGIPQNYLEAFAELAIKEGHKDATADGGPWMLSVDINGYKPVFENYLNITFTRSFNMPTVVRFERKYSELNQLSLDLLSEIQAILKSLTEYSNSELRRQKF